MEFPKVHVYKSPAVIGLKFVNEVTTVPQPTIGVNVNVDTGFGETDRVVTCVLAHPLSVTVSTTVFNPVVEYTTAAGVYEVDEVGEPVAKLHV